MGDKQDLCSILVNVDMEKTCPHMYDHTPCRNCEYVIIVNEKEEV